MSTMGALGIIIATNTFMEPFLFLWKTSVLIRQVSSIEGVSLERRFTE